MLFMLVCHAVSIIHIYNNMLHNISDFIYPKSLKTKRFDEANNKGSISFYGIFLCQINNNMICIVGVGVIRTRLRMAHIYVLYCNWKLFQLESSVNQCCSLTEPTTNDTPSVVEPSCCKDCFVFLRKLSKFGRFLRS